MTPRLRRLASDFELVSRLFAENPRVRLVRTEGTPPDRQPPAGPCAEVARRRGSEGGRLLYMPASDLRG